MTPSHAGVCLLLHYATGNVLVLRVLGASIINSKKNLLDKLSVDLIFRKNIK